MAVTDDYAPVREEGNGIKVAFDADFPVLSATDVKVGKVLRSTNVKTDMVYGVDYTVTIDDATRRPTVTYTVAPTALEDSWIGRDVPNTQTAVIPTNSIFREVQVNNALDKLCMVSQQLQEQINRCPIQPETSTAVVVFPEPEDGKAPVWDGTSGSMVNADVDPVAIGEAVTAAEAAQTLAELAQTAAEAAQASAEDAQNAAEAAAAAIPAKATQAEAEAGVIDTAYMTPLKAAQAIAALGTKIKIGTFQRDLTAASEDVQYTGVGFTPKALIAFSTLQHSGPSSEESFGFGMSSGPAVNYGMTQFGANGYMDNVSAAVALYSATAPVGQSAVVKSFDADGFTLTWTKAGSPTGTMNVFYLAIG